MGPATVKDIWDGLQLPGLGLPVLHIPTHSHISPLSNLEADALAQI